LRRVLAVVTRRRRTSIACAMFVVCTIIIIIIIFIRPYIMFDIIYYVNCTIYILRYGVIGLVLFGYDSCVRGLTCVTRIPSSRFRLNHAVFSVLLKTELLKGLVIVPQKRSIIKSLDINNVPP